METASPPRTADGDRFRFRAGRPSLDLCSTVLWRHVSPVEQLRHPDDVARWLAEAGLWTEPHPVSDADVRTVRALREALYRLFLARIRGEKLPGARLVNRCAAHPGPTPRLTSDGQTRWLIRDPVPTALSAVARDGIELLTGALSGRVRECAAPDCAFLFVDTSRPGTRRWCAHNRCGNREHVREHRARERARLV
ncbi:MAG TPA: CGNR zinc finger domain-containing protein [Actinomycetes bacterium]